jgi:predicted transcriptional regulator
MKIKSVAQIEVDRMEANLKQDISNLKINLANAIRLGTKEGYEQKTREVLALLAKQREYVEKEIKATMVLTQPTVSTAEQNVAYAVLTL